MFNLSPAKTVDGVLAEFNRTITQLETIANQQLADEAKQRDAARKALEAADAAKVEAGRAKSISAKIAALIA